MPSFFSRKKGKEDAPHKLHKKGALQSSHPDAAPAQPSWEDAWTRRTVEPEEIQELIKGCTIELKSRALDVPFLLLPFRPTSDPSASRSFIRNYFDRAQQLHGETLATELRLTEPMVLCSVIKWCWSRLPGGVVSWEVYDLFKVGESDSNMARDAFTTFIPLSVESDAKAAIIFDFFDLLSAVAAHSKSNGLGGRKLSRLAAWWAFEHADTQGGFEPAYNIWGKAADATSHLFFAHLRANSPDAGAKGFNISNLPVSLQKLVHETEYPPERPYLMQQSTTKVIMIVDNVSPTPFALLRRANNFQYRDDDIALKGFAEYEDPVEALTTECRRVLKSISSANQSQVSNTKESTGLRDASWSRFEDIGFSSEFQESKEEDASDNFKNPPRLQGLRTTPHSKTLDMGRPTTPSWADFLSSGFVEEASSPPPLLLPPDKILPPIDTRGRSSQSHAPRLESDRHLEPGELASITIFDLDDSFWWVWICSLAGEETPERKAAFGRCALIETVIPGGKWLVMEEIVKGAAPEPDAGAYIAEKKSFWGRSKRNKGMTRRKSTGKRPNEDTLHPGFQGQGRTNGSKTSVGPDQHARIQAAAYQLQQRQRQQDEAEAIATRRGRNDSEAAMTKTQSVLTLQPVIAKEASPALKWASKYDKDAIRAAYLANSATGRGASQLSLAMSGTNGYARSEAPPSFMDTNSAAERELPAVPTEPEEQPKPVEPVQIIEPPAPTPTIVVPPAPLPPTPTEIEDERIVISEKAAEAALPDETHPADRHNDHMGMPPVAPVASYRSQDERQAAPYVADTSPLGKRNKLKKKDAPASGATGGFRKLFGRSKRQSKIITPQEASNNLQTVPSRDQRYPEQVPSYAGTSIHETDHEATPVPSPHPAMLNEEADPSQPYAHSTAGDGLSRVNTDDAQEAHHAFSRFDQGPLEDHPADLFPVASDDEGSIPPPVSKSTHDEEQFVSPMTPTHPDAELDDRSPEDKWARIRKAAADRVAARQSEEQSRGGYSQKTDGDDETSGEETIESRVARIKARVAELVGPNAEGVSTSPPPPAGRR